MSDYNKELSDLGFSPASSDTTHRIIMSISGREKQGKTHFALTAPGPIAFFNTDIGLEGVKEKFVDQKKIFVNDIEIHHDQTLAEKEWERFVKGYNALLKMPIVRTMVIDTATEIWELLRIAKFGKLAQVKPHHYGPVNAEYRRLIKAAYESDKNLILLHKMKKEYVDDKYTGKFQVAGFGDTGFLVQVNCIVSRQVDDEGMPSQFQLKVIDCRQNADVAGMVFEGEMSTFSLVAPMVVAGTSPNDWE